MLGISTEIWINLGCFVIGLLFGGLILFISTRKVRKNLKDPWEEMDEMDQAFEEVSIKQEQEYDSNSS